MTESGFRDLLSRLAQGWADRDYTAVAGRFAENIRYADPLRYSFCDRASLLAFFQADQGCDQKTRFHLVLFDQTRQIGVAEYTYEGTHRYHGVAIIKVDNDLITHWREYQHIDQRPWEQFISGTQFPTE